MISIENYTFPQILSQFAESCKNDDFSTRISGQNWQKIRFSPNWLKICGEVYFLMLIMDIELIFV